MMWNFRLGHPHYSIIQSILKSCNVKNVNKSQLDFCNACCLAKSHRLPGTKSKTEYVAPLDLLFMDVWGPVKVESRTGSLYYLSIVDAHSKFIWYYPLKRKYDVFGVFVQFKT